MACLHCVISLRGSHARRPLLSNLRGWTELAKEDLRGQVSLDLRGLKGVDLRGLVLTVGVNLRGHRVLCIGCRHLRVRQLCLCRTSIARGMPLSRRVRLKGVNTDNGLWGLL